MADELLKTFEADIKSLTLIPSSGGVFEVNVNGELVFSKKALGRHAQPNEIAPLVKAKTGG